MKLTSQYKIIFTFKMAACSESIVEDEIAVLQSIYLPDELQVASFEDRSVEVVVMLHPYTADNEDEKYVCMQLVINLDNQYPHSKPSFDIKMPRGISDAQIESILANLDGLASHKIGEEMLFELIEYAKECLTNNNRPECPCAICLELFETDECFTRTDCFHFFHDVCIARYLTSYVEEQDSRTDASPMDDQDELKKNVIPCPICRNEIEKSQLKTDCIDLDSNSTDEPSAKFLAWRKRMSTVFKRQQKRGGIIDIEAEKNKFLIETKRAAEKQTTVARNENWISDSGSQILTNIDHWTEGDGVNDRLAINMTKTQPSAKESSLNPKKKYADYSYKQRNKNVPRKEPGRVASAQKSSRRETSDIKQDNKQSGHPDRFRGKDVTFTQKQRQNEEYEEGKRNSSQPNESRVSKNSSSKRDTVENKSALPVTKSAPLKTVEKRIKPPPGFKPIV